MRILYVEDNEVNRALVERVMRARQCSVVFEDEGEGALATLAKDPAINLILLDIELAGSMTGLDVIRTLRARNDHRPVVAVTAYAMMGDRERFLEAGCDQYLPKPLVVTDLLNMIDHYQADLAKATEPAPIMPVDSTPASAEAVPAPAEPAPSTTPTIAAAPAGAPAAVEAATAEPLTSAPEVDEPALAAEVSTNGDRGEEAKPDAAPAQAAPPTATEAASTPDEASVALPALQMTAPTVVPSAAAPQADQKPPEEGQRTS